MEKNKLHQMVVILRESYPKSLKHSGLGLKKPNLPGNSAGGKKPAAVDMV